MAEGVVARKAVTRFLPNVKKGFVMVIFEVPEIQPAMLSKKKAKNADVQVHIPNEPGDFGSVKIKDGMEYALEATADRFGTVRTKWDTEGS